MSEWQMNIMEFTSYNLLCQTFQSSRSIPLIILIALHLSKPAQIRPPHSLSSSVFPLITLIPPWVYPLLFHLSICLTPSQAVSRQGRAMLFICTVDRPLQPNTDTLSAKKRRQTRGERAWEPLKCRGMASWPKQVKRTDNLLPDSGNLTSACKARAMVSYLLLTLFNHTHAADF